MYIIIIIIFFIFFRIVRAVNFKCPHYLQIIVYKNMLRYRKIQINKKISFSFSI